MGVGADCFADTEGAAEATASVIDALSAGVVDQLEDEGGDAHADGRAEAPDHVPLQFGDAVAHADDGRPEAEAAQEARLTGHEAAVVGGHELDDIVRATAADLVREVFAEREAIEVAAGIGEGDRLAEGAGGGDVVENLGAGDAEEILVVALEVFLGRDGKSHEVFEAPDAADVDADFGKSAAVEGRPFIDVSQCLDKALLLIGFDLRLGEILKGYTIHGVTRKTKSYKRTIGRRTPTDRCRR